jgi:hypothetical protein
LLRVSTVNTCSQVFSLISLISPSQLPATTSTPVDPVDRASSTSPPVEPPLHLRVPLGWLWWGFSSDGAASDREAASRFRATTSVCGSAEHQFRCPRGGSNRPLVGSTACGAAAVSGADLHGMWPLGPAQVTTGMVAARCCNRSSKAGCGRASGSSTARDVPDRRVQVR